jgi:hypothetical protein
MQAGIPHLFAAGIVNPASPSTLAAALLRWYT